MSTQTEQNRAIVRRDYEYASDLVEEIIDARVWGGIHYRESDVKGARRRTGLSSVISCPCSE